MGAIISESMGGLPRIQQLGPLALQMGLASMRRLNPIRIATEAIAELVLRINHAVALSVWGNHGPTVVRIEEGTGAVHVNMRVGSIMSLLGTVQVEFSQRFFRRK